MTNTNTTVTELKPNGGTTNSGINVGYLSSTANAAQNDTITITNASSIVHAELKEVVSGTAMPYTLSDNEITCTAANAGSVRGIIYYKKI